MPPPQGLIHFPGLSGIIGGTFVYGHGVKPSVAVVSVVPTANFPAEIGTMELSFGNTLMQFPQCKIDSANLSIRRGYIVGVRILDRRWKWDDTGEITGNYNIRDKAGDLKTSLEKTPHELAALCFQAMGELTFDVSRLPNECRPIKKWIAANPASELDALCGELGCTLAIGLDNIPRIFRVGIQEIALPPNAIMSREFGVDPSDLPDSILFVGGRTKYQARWKLEAVGKELVTDEFVPVDDLSYKPLGGWEMQDPKEFGNVESEFGNDAHSLALESVWKTYRITTAFDSLLLPLENHVPDTWSTRSKREEVTLLNEQVRLDIAGKPLKPVVRGVWYKGKLGIANTPDFSVFEDSFSIDSERGIVSFSVPVYKKVMPGGIGNKPADLLLETAYEIKNTDTEMYHRWRKEREALLKKKRAGPFVIRREDVFRTLRMKYPPNFFSPSDIIDNLVTVERETNFVTDARLAEFQTKNTFARQYAGLLDIPLDGAIRQVAWNWGRNGPATTRVSVNFEANPFVPSLETQRAKQKTANAAKIIAAFQGHPIMSGITT